MHSKALFLALGALSFVAAQDTTSFPVAPVVSDNVEGTSYIATFPDKKTSRIRGTIKATAGKDGIEFKVDLTGLPDSSLGPFMYHIHELPVPSDGNCSGTKAHLDPTKRGEVPACDSSRAAECQTGDLSGKHGNITAASWSVSYTDTYLSTTPGNPSFFGDLSVVIHTNNKTRLTCANFTMADVSPPSSTVSGAPTGTGYPTGGASATGSIYPPIPTGGAAGIGASVGAALLGLAAFVL